MFLKHANNCSTKCSLTPTFCNRNLKCNFFLVEEGDLVWVVSDGVHDNIDPQLMGHLPNQLDSDITSDDWELLPPETAARLKNDFSMKFLEKKFLKKAKRGELLRERSATYYFYQQMKRGAIKLEENKKKPSDGSFDNTEGQEEETEEEEEEEEVGEGEGEGEGGAQDGIDLDPSTITKLLIRHCLRQTYKARNFMELHPEQRQPSDLKEYPGTYCFVPLKKNCVGYDGVKRNLHFSNSQGNWITPHVSLFGSKQLLKC